MTQWDWAIIVAGTGALFGFCLVANPLVLPLSWLCTLTLVLHLAMIAATFYFFLTPGSVAAMFPNLERWLRKEFRGERTT